MNRRKGIVPAQAGQGDTGDKGAVWGYEILWDFESPKP